MKDGLYSEFYTDLISKEVWKHMGGYGRAILPVVIAHKHKTTTKYKKYDKNEPPKVYMYLTHLTLCEYTGLTLSELQKGIRQLKAKEIENYIDITSQMGNRGAYIYYVQIKYHAFFKGRYFLIPHLLIMNYWRDMTLTEKSVLPVMRFLGTKYKDAHLEGSEFLQSFCNSDIEIICNYASVSRRSYFNAVKSLQEKGFLEKEKSGYVVRMLPIQDILELDLESRRYERICNRISL
jgi:hypothetical protein